MANNPGRIDNQTLARMFGAALLFDSTQALVNLAPYVGQVLSSGIDLLALMFFSLWFVLKGQKLLTARHLRRLGGGFLIEIVPLINILPAWSFMIALYALDNKVKELKPSAPTVEENNISDNNPRIGI